MYSGENERMNQQRDAGMGNLPQLFECIRPPEEFFGDRTNQDENDSINHNRHERKVADKGLEEGAMVARTYGNREFSNDCADDEQHKDHGKNKPQCHQARGNHCRSNPAAFGAIRADRNGTTHIRP